MTVSTPHREALSSVGALLTEAREMGVGMSSVSLHLIDQEYTFLEVVAEVGMNPAFLDAWRSIPLAANLSMCDSVRQGVVHWSATAEEYARRFPWAMDNPIRRSLVTVPVTFQGRTLGVMVVLWDEGFARDEEVVGGLLGVASRVGEVLGGAAGSPSALFGVMRADMDVLEDPHRVAAVESLHALDMPIPLGVEKLVELTAYLLEAPAAQASLFYGRRRVTISQTGDVRVDEEGSICALVVSSRSGIVVSNVHQDVRVMDLPVVVQKVVGAYAGVPLIGAAGQVLGTLCVLDSRPRGWREGTLRILEDLAGAVMRELELREAERRLRERGDDLSQRLDTQMEITNVLQRSLLPAHLPSHPRVGMGAFVSPAVAGLMLAGDWYDAFALDEERVAVVVGDVAGHGLEAASLSAQVRYAVRTLLLAGMGPGEALAKTNEQLLPLGPEMLVTCVAGVVDASTGTFTWGNAGQVPPLLTRGGVGRALEGPTGPMLGVPAGEWDEEEITLERGDVVFLYTDGMVEERGSDLQARVDLLVERCAGLVSRGVEVEDLGACLLQEMFPRGAQDDVCALAVEWL